MTDFPGKATAEDELAVSHEAEIPCEVEQELVPIVEDPQLESKEKVAIILRTIHKQEMFSGPIPSPRVMAEYEKILPGSADRIMKMAEEQSKHRMNLERMVVPKQIKQSGRAQHYAFALCILLILAGFYALYCGYKAVSFGIFTVTIIAVLSIFLEGKLSMRRDLKEKSDDSDSQ